MSFLHKSIQEFLAAQVLVDAIQVIYFKTKMKTDYSFLIRLIRLQVTLMKLMLIHP